MYNASEFLKPNTIKTRTLFCLGHLRYEDIFGNRYILGFCGVLDPLQDNFVLRGDERYNYSRREMEAKRRSPWRKWIGRE
jgi:hypothetical protein